MRRTSPKLPDKNANKSVNIYTSCLDKVMKY